MALTLANAIKELVRPHQEAVAIKGRARVKAATVAQVISGEKLEFRFGRDGEDGWTIGLEPPGPGSGVFQTIASFAFHETGGFVAELTPRPLGPRN